MGLAQHLLCIYLFRLDLIKTILEICIFYETLYVYYVPLCLYICYELDAS